MHAGSRIGERGSCGYAGCCTECGRADGAILDTECGRAGGAVLATECGRAGGSCLEHRDVEPEALDVQVGSAQEAGGVAPR